MSSWRDAASRVSTLDFLPARGSELAASLPSHFFPQSCDVGYVMASVPGVEG